MTLQYQIVNKNSIHITLDAFGAEKLLNDLSNLLIKKKLSIQLGSGIRYKGKQLDNLKFIIANSGEFVTFFNNELIFEIEEQMVKEFILFVKNAVKLSSFKTPEIISFSPKTAKDVEVTIYGFINII